MAVFDDSLNAAAEGAFVEDGVLIVVAVVAVVIVAFADGDWEGRAALLV